MLFATTSFVIGESGSANKLLVTNHGTNLSYGSSVIGLNATASNNSALVTGAGSSWSNAVSLTVGYDGSGNSMTVSNVGRVWTGPVTNPALTNGGIIGFNAGSSNNSALVTGAGSTWSNAANLTVGYEGSGNSLVISNGGSVTAAASSVGNNAGASQNRVQVTGSSAAYYGPFGELIPGSSSTWNAGSNLAIGDAGSDNSMVVSDGGKVLASSSSVGNNAGSANNSAVVTGAGSAWSNAATLTVGNGGSGNSLMITNGGNVTAATSTVGFNTGATSNSAVVTGNGSTWTSSGDLLVGVSGSGNSMTVSGGATAANGQATYGAVVGLNTNSIGNSVLVTVADRHGTTMGASR